MLSLFRRGATQKYVMLLILIVALIAIVVTGFGTQGMGGLGELTTGTDALVSVEGEKITAKDVTDQVERQLNRLRQEQPELSTAQFIGTGGFDQIMRDLTAQKALVAFGRDQGLAVSKRMVDGEIASIPAFKNLAGQFDENAFKNALAQQRMSEQQLRREIEETQIQQLMFAPVTGAGAVPNEMAKQYASLLLERRSGAIGMVPAAAVGPGADPTQAEIQTYFQKNSVRYAIPERRVIRYAMLDRTNLGQAAVATPAEIEAFYKSNQDKYGPSETRTLAQVVLPNKAAADAFAAKLAKGTSFEQAAQEAGFSSADTTIGSQTKQAFSDLAAPAVANAAFGVAAGATTAPVQSPLGWHIVKVDAINRSPGKPLAEVQGEIKQQIEDKKAQEQLADKVGRLEDKVADGASFQEVAKAEGLTIAETPLITATGQQPGAPAQPFPALQPIFKPAFEMQPGDDPQVQALVPNQSFALFEVTRVVPAAPPPLAQIAEQVKGDLMKQRALDRSRVAAAAIVAKINKGTAPAQAFGEAGVKLPPVEQVDLRRMDIARQGQQVPASLALLFSLPAGRAQMIPAPQGQGWFVVTNLKAERGDASGVPPLIAATRSQFKQVLSSEYAEEFVNAVQANIKVRRNEQAILKTRQQLMGAAAE